MDRNADHTEPRDQVRVALRKESVDRNIGVVEIFGVGQVALRKESVDRNSFGFSCWAAVIWSLSARRAWIEIEGIEGAMPALESRSPQGERG